MNSEYVGVKFFSATDLSIGSNLKKAERIIKNFDENNIILNINSVLELYNICLIFDSEVKLEQWSEDQYYSLKLIVREFRPIIGKFLNEFDYLKIDSLYNEINTRYRETFWEVFYKYRIYKKIDGCEFISILEKYKVPIKMVLKYKEIVDKYDNQISDYMNKFTKTAEFLIEYLLTSKNENSIKYYIPKSLQAEQQIKIIEEYINNEDANPNYLILITNSRRTDNFPISDEIRLKSKKKYENYIEKNLNNIMGLPFVVIIEFLDSEDVVNISIEDKYVLKIKYSRIWLKENLDKPTLLNNFIYLFNFVDQFCRSTFPSNKNTLSSLEREIGLKGIREYQVGISFSIRELVSSLTIKKYFYQLGSFNVIMEEIFKWFFEEYLKEEFQVENFKFSIPSLESSFLEKMRTMCSELDSILRLFTIYINNGEIDRELVEISRNTPLIEEIPSFLSKKYGYIIDDELLRISNILFSDQSLLAYMEKKEKYSCFVDLIINENLNISDFLNYQTPIIYELIEKKIIYINIQGYIRLYVEIFTILEDFYYNDVICITYYKSDLLDLLIAENKILCESTLFSKPEQNYINYILNDKSYDNGPSIRNKYSHGNNPQNTDEQENDYFKLLKIIALIIIKINEEFCLKEELKETTK